MGRNYRCWIVGGLRARAPVKCLCFPSCLPSKDLHILTHYSVLWSWSAWLPQPAITLIASKKLKSFKALWPHSWGKMYVCFSPSPSLSHSLSLSAAVVVWGLGYCSSSIYNVQKSVWHWGLVLCPCCCGYFLLSHIHVKTLNGCSFSAACTLSIHSKLCVFVFALSFLTYTQRHIVRLTTFSLTASLVYLSDSRVSKSSLEVRCVRRSVCVCPKRKRQVFLSLWGSPECLFCRVSRLTLLLCD